MGKALGKKMVKKKYIEMESNEKSKIKIIK